MSRTRTQSGFTILELVLVLVLLAVLVGLVMPALFGQLSQTKLDSTADQLVGLIQRARLEAMQRGGAVRVNYDVDQRSFYLDAEPTTQDQLSASGGAGTMGSSSADQETSPDGYIRISPIWSVGQKLLDEVTIKTTLINPPNLRMLVQELQQQQTSSQGTLGGQSTINNSFTLPSSSFDQPPDLPPAEGNLIPVEFDGDGTPRGQISLRIVIAARKADDTSDTTSASASLSGNEQLDVEEQQRWISVEGLTGRVYAANPSKEIIELANQHQGQNQQSSSPSGPSANPAGGAP